MSDSDDRPAGGPGARGWVWWRGVRGRLREGAYLLVLASGLLAVYLPALLLDFGLHNDYGFFAGAEPGHPEARHLMAIGRPLQAVLQNALGRLIVDVSAFRWVRGVSVLAVILSAWLFARYLTGRLATPRAWATGISFCIFTLPSAQVYVLAATGMVLGSFNVLLSVVCYLLLDAATGPERGGWRWARRVIAGAGAAGCLLAALCIYPPTALFLLTFTAARIVFSPAGQWPQTRRYVVRDVCFVVLGMTVYFVAQRFVILPALTGDPDLPHYTFRLSFAAGAVILAWMRATVVALPGAWDLVGGWWAGPVFAAVLTVGLPLAWLTSAPAGAESRVSRRRVLRAAGVVVAMGVALLIPLAPFLLAAGSSRIGLGYRLLFAYGAGIVMLVFRVFYRPGRPGAGSVVGRLVLLVWVVSCGALAWRNVDWVARKSHGELASVRRSMARVDFRTTFPTMVLPAPTGRGPALGVDLTFRSEFTMVPSGEMMAAFITDPEMRQMICVVLAYPGVPVVLERAAEVMAPVVPLRGRGGDGRGIETAKLRVSSAAANPIARAQMAFDNNRHGTFWEAYGYPQWAQVSYRTPRALSAYTLSAGGAKAEWMPWSWQFQGSADGVRWVVLDRRDREDAWKLCETRTFRISDARAFGHYRLLFTAGSPAATGVLRIYDIELIPARP